MSGAFVVNEIGLCGHCRSECRAKNSRYPDPRANSRGQPRLDQPGRCLAGLFLRRPHGPQAGWGGGKHARILRHRQCALASISSRAVICPGRPVVMPVSHWNQNRRPSWSGRQRLFDRSSRGNPAVVRWLPAGCQVVACRWFGGAGALVAGGF